MKPFCKYISIAALLLSLILASCTAATPEATNRLEEVQARGTLICGTSADLPPYEFVNDEGEFDGFEMEYIRELGERMGLEVEIQDMAFDSIIANVQAGNVDCGIAKIKGTPTRDEQVDFTEPYFNDVAGIIAREDAGIELTSPFDMANYVVGTQAGNVPTEWITTNLIETGEMPEENLLNYERAEEGILDLAAGRIDLWVTESVAARQAVAQIEGLEVVLVTSEWNVPAVILVAEGEQELAGALSEVIQETIEEGTWQALLEEWEIPIPTLPME